eukprot:jgi/Botrbrau1/5786/Bobra.0155s0009.1
MFFPHADDASGLVGGTNKGRGRAAPRVKLRVTRVWLEALNFLRSCWLDATLAMGSRAATSAGYGAASWAQPEARGQEPDPDNKVYWVGVDYLEVAWAALGCSACFTALLYCELWCEEAYGHLYRPEPSLLDEGPPSLLDRILLEVGHQAPEPDGIYAVAFSDKLSSQLALFQHEGNWARAQVGFDMQMQSRETHRRYPGYPGGSSGPQDGLLRALQQLGCHHLVKTYLSTLPKATEEIHELDEVQQEAGWRMGEWAATPDRPGGLDSALGGFGGAPPFNAALSASLQALREGDAERCGSLLAGARTGVVASLGALVPESVSTVDPALVQLEMLRAVGEAWGVKWPNRPLVPNCLILEGVRSGERGPGGGQADSNSATIPGEAATEQLQEVWRAREALAGAGGRYALQEPLVALRGLLLRALGHPGAAALAGAEAARAARKAGRLEAAMVSVYRLHDLLNHETRSRGENVPEWAAKLGNPTAGWRVEEAKLLRAQGQTLLALRLCRALLEATKSHLALQGSADPQGTPAAVLLPRARLLTLTGKWLAESRSENPETISTMMADAVQLLTEAAPVGRGVASYGTTLCRCAYRLAQYCDSLYRGIQAQRASPEWRTQQAVIAAKKRQVEEYKKALREREARGTARRGPNGELLDLESRQLAALISGPTRHITADEALSAAVSRREAQQLALAIDNFTLCLTHGSAYDLPVVFRLCQLLFALEKDSEAVARLRGPLLKRVPSFKLVPLVYQLASRLSARGDRPGGDFQDLLAELMLRLAKEHPYHTLYQLFALKNGDRGRDGKRVPAGGSGPMAGTTQTIDYDKVAAADSILAQYRASSRDRSEVTAQMSSLISGYIELAAMAPKASDKDTMPFPSHLRRSLRNLTKLPVVSRQLPVDPSARYEGFAHFDSFGDTIRFVGGINKPKLVECFDSNGVRHRQLVKSGSDDLRQDAVMQQFFALVNQVLAAHPTTRSRGLRIVTFKVVPFTPASGLLEWVENTMPLSEYLIGRDRMSGAHLRYARPDDYSFADCHHLMHKPPEGDLRAAWDDVCEHFQPVLHHFFLEHFRDPPSWYKRRLAFTRSTAVNSMAGYIIGLGDRHLQNILIDERGAEVVHIDLGVAFEQGRFLTTPELVPFRLTRDIVDGMGIAGVEGVMRRCCEAVLRVLRAHKEALVTIVEVLIHDPLYRWALTPASLARRQGEGAAEPSSLEDGGGGLANADAERAVLRVKQKLLGLESGEGEARGVEGQVHQLLHDARDADNLCRMYVGWAAWL